MQSTNSSLNNHTIPVRRVPLALPVLSWTHASSREQHWQSQWHTFQQASRPVLMHDRHLRLFRRRNRSSRWFPFSGPNVRASGLSVLVRGHRIGAVTVLCLFEQFFDERNAPSATSAGSTALADLAGPPRFVDADEIADLPFRDVEAVADCVVEFHQLSFDTDDRKRQSFRLGRQPNGLCSNNNTKPMTLRGFTQNPGGSRLLHGQFDCLIQLLYPH